MSLMEAERSCWCNVLTCLVAIIQSLVEGNLALRGSTDTLYQPNNGNFLKEVELLAKFDPIMKQHVECAESGISTHATYLGKTIQNELIESISGRVMEHMVREIKESKYYSIILDCTPDAGHEEQMSMIIRSVTLENTPIVKEHFMWFLLASETTGQSLSTLVLDRLEDLNISFDDCRGQSYDNGANMRGKHKGVIQKLFNLFLTATQRWAILTKHVEITLNSWSETRWESRDKSVEAIRFQAAEIREALLEVREKATDPVVRIEAQSLAEEVGSYMLPHLHSHLV
ncbi:hypothetical protein LDENG_00047980 [Lucifuga dentata]|nr:hypothetical protein LDENG_00047980 [Lucifuga dentata]